MRPFLIIVFMLCSCLLLPIFGNNTDFEESEDVFKEGRQFFRDDEYVRAEESIRNTLKKIEKTSGRNSVDYAEGLELLGALCSIQNRFSDEEKHYSEALQIYENLGEHEYIADIYSRFADIYRKQKRWGKAEEYLKKTYSEFSDNPGDYHINIAYALLNLATFTEHEKNNSVEALPYYEKALSILKTEDGDESKDYYFWISSYAQCLYNSEQYVQAASLFEKIYNFYSQRAASDEFEMFDTSLGAARAFKKLKNVEKSGQFYLESLKYAGKGKNDEEVPFYRVRTNFILGEYYELKELYDESVDSFNLAIAEAKEIYQPDSIFLKNMIQQRDEVLKKESGFNSWLKKTTGSRTMKEAYGAVSVFLLFIFLYLWQSRIRGANRIYKYTVKIKSMILGENHRWLAKNYKMLSDSLYIQNNFSESVLYRRKEIAIKEKQFSEDDPNLLISFYFLAAALLRMNNTDEAEKILKQILEKVLPDASDKTTKIYSLITLAYICSEKKNTDQSEKYLKSAVQCAAQQTAELKNYVYARIIEHYDRLGEYRKELEYYEQQFSLVLNHFGMNHYQTASLAGTYGVILYRCGHLKKAEELFEKALHVFNTRVKSQAERKAMCLNNYAVLKIEQGDYAKAQELLNIGNNANRKSVNNRQGWQMILNTSQGHLYLKQNMLKEAECCFLKSIHYYNSVKDFYKGSAANNYILIAELSLMKGNLSEAEQYCREAEKMYEGTASENPGAYRLWNCRGLCCSIKKEYDIAESHFLKSVELLEKNHDPAHSRIIEILENIKKLYTDWRQTEKAEKIENRLRSFSAEFSGDSFFAPAELSPIHKQKQYWILEGTCTLGDFFNAVKKYIPDGILYLENGCWDAEISSFLESHSAGYNVCIEPGSAGKVKSYHLPVSKEIIDYLYEYSQNHAVPEIAEHIHVWREKEIIVEMHDCLAQPVLLNCSVPEETVKGFAAELKMNYRMKQ